MTWSLAQADATGSNSVTCCVAHTRIMLAHTCLVARQCNSTMVPRRTGPMQTFGPRRTISFSNSGLCELPLQRTARFPHPKQPHLSLLLLHPGMFLAAATGATQLHQSSSKNMILAVTCPARSLIIGCAHFWEEWGSAALTQPCCLPSSQMCPFDEGHARPDITWTMSACASGSRK